MPSGLRRGEKYRSVRLDLQPLARRVGGELGRVHRLLDGRAEHCWNGDHENGNHISRLRYNTMYLPRILERIEATAPEGADLTSWRY